MQKLRMAITVLMVLTCPVFGQSKKWDGVVISYTNSKGVVFTNVAVKAVTLDEVIWQSETPEGRKFGGRVKLDDLPPELQIQLGYNPAKAALQRQANAAAIAQNARAAASRASAQRVINQAVATQMRVIGRVTQVLEAGLMITAEFQTPNYSIQQVTPGMRFAVPYTVERFGPPADGVPLFVGRLLLTGAEKSGWSDGQPISALVYPNGTYTYSSVAAGTATVQRFTLNPALAVETPTPEQFNALKNTYRYNTKQEFITRP